FDRPAAVRAWLGRLQPRALVLLELEIWPQLLLACRQRGIPVYLINARCSARSYAGYRQLGALLQPAFAAIDGVLAQNALWAARLKHLGARGVSAGGSLKADLVQPSRPDQQQQLAQRLGINRQQPVLLIASTSAGEELPFIHAWPQLRHILSHWQLIIVPRHPERGNDLAADIRQQGMNCWQSSQQTNPSDEANMVWLIDEIGVLGAAYGLADMAVVGGSLGSKRGSQNMLEAVAHHCATIVGPDTRNFPDAMTLLLEGGGIIQVPDQQAAIAVIKRLSQDPTERHRLGDRGYHLWQQARGAVAALDHWLITQGR
ncbi:MAG: hypothetical protein F6K62_23860, partial [Sphaerospermopsis sp. SIO1G2]|nr:hypothetical protein [Sphaerospermopsis sp. SIO1G2]